MVALVKDTEFGLVIEPSVFINSTIGTVTKFVPVMLIVVAVAGAIVWLTSATVGLVSVGTSANDRFPEPSVFK